MIGIAIWIIAIAVAANALINMYHVFWGQMKRRDILKMYEEDVRVFNSRVDRLENELRETIDKMYQDLEKIIKA